jgi:hypothetical protein
MMIGTKDCRWALLAVVLAIVGCGGDDDADSVATAAQESLSTASLGTPASQTTETASNPPSTTATEALIVQGVPATAASIGTIYSFRPTVVDAAGTKLTFEIANKPKWATFSPTTGQLQGTPTNADVGTNKNIVIQVTDGRNFTTLPVFSITVPPVALGSATLAWSPPTQYTSGSQLASLRGYKIYWGTAADNLSNSKTIENAGLTRYVVENLAPGKYYFVMTALDPSGIESSHSALTTKTII